MDGKQSQCMGVIFLLINKVKTLSLDADPSLSPGIIGISSARASSSSGGGHVSSYASSPPSTPKSSGGGDMHVEVSSSGSGPSPAPSPRKEPSPSAFSTGGHAKPAFGKKPHTFSAAVPSNVGSNVGSNAAPAKKRPAPIVPPRSKSVASNDAPSVVPASTVGALAAQLSATLNLSAMAAEDVPSDPEKRREFYIVKLQTAARGLLARRTLQLRLKQQKEVMSRFEGNSAESAAAVKKLVRLQATVRGMLERNTPVLRARRKRNEIVKEIMSTEEKYVKQLTVLVQVYMKALEGLGEAVLPAAKIRSIFSEIKVIVSYNQVIYNMLKARVGEWYAKGQTLGDIFVKFTDFLKVYTAYVNNYNESMSTMQDQMINNPAFVETLQTCREDPRVASMEMSSFLIMPIQRIPRYVLLLSDLFKNTPENHKDHVTLKEALSKMEGVASYVNKKKREAENLLGVTTVARHLVGLESVADFNQPHRRYVRQGFLQEADAGSPINAKSLKTRYMFLFNDILVGTKEYTGVLGRSKVPATGFDIDSLRNSDAQFKYLYSFQLLGALIHEIPEQNKVAFTFELVEAGTGKKLLLVAPSQQVKDEWIQDLDEMIMSCLEKHRSRIGVPVSEERTEVPQDQKAQNLTGTLYKRSESGSWKKRYFVLSQDVLTYYPDILSSVDSMIAPKTIPLIFAGVMNVPLMDRPFCLRLFTKDRVYVLSAESAHERLQWVNMIRSAISKRLTEIDLKLKTTNTINAAFSPYTSGSISLIGGSLVSLAQPDGMGSLKASRSDKRDSLDSHHSSSSPAPGSSPSPSLAHHDGNENGTANSTDVVSVIASVLSTAGSSSSAASSPSSSPAPSSPGSEKKRTKKDKSGTLGRKAKTISGPAPTAAEMAAAADGNDSNADAANNQHHGSVDDAQGAETPSEKKSSRSSRKERGESSSSKDKDKEISSSSSSAAITSKDSKDKDSKDKDSKDKDSKGTRKKKLKRDQTLSKITKTGDVYKFSSGSSKVVKQKMVLKSGELQLFKSGKSKPVTAIDLLLVQTPSNHIEATNVKDVAVYQFTLVTSDRKYVFGAESEDEAQAWIDIVQLAREALNPTAN